MFWYWEYKSFRYLFPWNHGLIFRIRVNDASKQRQPMPLFQDSETAVHYGQLLVRRFNCRHVAPVVNTWAQKSLGRSMVD